MKLKFERNENYCYLFNYKTGKSVTIENNKFFERKEGPNLLDVSITSRCNRCCDFCYRQSSWQGKDISFDDYKLIIEHAKDCGVQQIALGGGEPTLHPNFCEILKLTKENGIVPNYSTNGDNLDDNILLITQEYCGAIAVSAYDDINKYESLIERLAKYNITVNLHLILRADKIKDYLNFLNNPPCWLKNINAIIFLNYKPANGNKELCFKNSDKKIIKEFFEVVTSFDYCGIGFDTCSISFLCKHMLLDDSLYDFCEAGRKSAYINENLDVYPCSFYFAEGVNLKNDSLRSIWETSNSFVRHREILKQYDANCAMVESCRRGCPIYDINFCDGCL